MVDYTPDNLLIQPMPRPDDPDQIIEVTPEVAGWEFISFQVRRLAAGDTWQFAIADNEMAIVTLSGTYTVETDRGTWGRVGGRTSVFSGLGHLLYLPRNTKGQLRATQAGEFAVACIPSQEDYEPFHVRPEHIKTAIRGGDNATRQINLLLPPGSPVHRLVVVEVYTPSGSWSSYPPHKHDVHRVDEQGSLLEADLEELYYFKFDRADGYALQQIYTDPSSPLHLAGRPINAVHKVTENDVVLVPEGYHPVCSPPGYCTYYLNVLAGTAQSLACTDERKFAWVKETYQTTDPRVPIYPLAQEPFRER